MLAFVRLSQRMMEPAACRLSTLSCTTTNSVSGMVPAGRLDSWTAAAISGNVVLQDPAAYTWDVYRKWSAPTEFQTVTKIITWW